MAHQAVNGIVLRYANYKDNDRMLTLFTQEQGRVDAAAYGCRRQKSPLLVCAQPFVFGEFQLFGGKGRNSVTQCDVRETFYPLREDMAKFQTAAMMNAVCAQVVQEDEPNLPLFSLLYHSLSFLCYGEVVPIDMALCFLLRFFQTTGVCPAITACAICAADVRQEKVIAFSPLAGGAVCTACAQSRHVTLGASALTLEAMRRILFMSDADMGNVRLPARVRQELFELVNAYGQHYFEREHRQISGLRTLIL